MNRRDFLHPRQLARTAGQVLGAAGEVAGLPAEAEPAGETALLRAGRRAMATNFEVVFPFGTPHALAMAEAALDEIDRLEDQLTVYRDTSEVSRLNRLAAGRPVYLEPGLFGLLELAARVHKETGGAYDVAAGALVKAWGFFRGPRRVPSEAERAEALARAGMGHVALDPARRTARFLRPGVEINLGSIGKGYALDRAAALLRGRWNPPAALLHGGHSSVYAMGTDPGDQRGWLLGVRHPWEPGRRLGFLRLREQAMGTSAATHRHLEYEGRKLGHLLDPRTGWPAEGMAGVTVVAPTAAEADALSTAFFVLGVERAAAYCASHPGVGAVLLPEGADEPAVVGLAPGQWSPA